MASLPNPLPSLATSGLDLPPGSLVDTTMDGTWDEPLLWYANDPATPRTWSAMRAAGKPLGLLPVLIDGGRRDQWPEEWDLDPDGTSYPGDHDAEEVLNDYRSYNTEEFEDDPGHLALAPARRPTGWTARTRWPPRSRARSSTCAAGSPVRGSPSSRPAAAPTYRRRSAGPAR